MAKGQITDIEVGTELARFVAETKYTDIPKDVIELAKRLTLKTVASTLAGATSPHGQKMAKLIKDRKLPEEAGVMGFGFKTSLWDSVYLNSFEAHSSELEDNRFSYKPEDQEFGGSSWDITIIPLLLPLAQKLKLSGKTIMAAMVLGLEAHIRTTFFNDEIRGVVNFAGAVGPAVAGARALGLSVKETTSALGLTSACCPVALTSRGSDAHFFESALVALQGIMAAEMAKAGLTAPPDVSLYLSNVLGKDKVSRERMVDGLGKKWLTREFWFKKYPICWGNHREIDAILELKKENNLTYQNVATIEVDIQPDHEGLNRPTPKTIGDLRFSLQHCLGTALLDGDVNLSHITDEAITDPRLVEARTKVKVISHPDWPVGLMKKPARITVKTKDGRQFTKERNTVIGSQEEPLTTQQFRDLYHKYSTGVLSEESITKTADAILNLENLSDVTELMDTLTFGLVKKAKK